MRKLSILTLLALVAGIAVPFLAPAPATATAADHYGGPWFGANNFPPDCTRDIFEDNVPSTCYRMKTGLNGLDSPQVDVLVLVPVSPTAERDLRVMRQSVEMWEAGIDHLAGQMGLEWLQEGVDFHVTVDYVDLQGGGGEFTTYPIVDPEIVVIGSNPVGGAGIGVDPVDFVAEVGLTDESEAPCHGIANPFDFEAWENLPGFDRHHDARSGTYVEDCGPGGGGNICFAVNGALEPAGQSLPELEFGLFDLVSHEFGHCLTLGHVGDGGETLIGQGWGPVPTNDIMSYSTDPPGLNKCVSTLDVEGLAIRMSRYLDVNGDGSVTGADELEANDQIGDGMFPFQVQHPDDHRYASSTGAPTDCPQPDLGLVPGERTNWTPEPVPTAAPALEVTSPSDGAASGDGAVTVAGTVEHRNLDGRSGPTSPPSSFVVGDEHSTRTVTRRGSFEVQQSGLGVTPAVAPVDSSHVHGIDVTRANVTVSLDWDAPLFLPSNLDLFVTGAADSGTAGATGNRPEVVTFEDVTGHLDIRVSPRSVGGVTSYKLRITVTPLDGNFGGLGTPDEDRDGVPDSADACPIYPGTGADGCTVRTFTTVRALVDGVVAGTAAVDADYSPAAFAIQVTIPEGDHQLTVEWIDEDGSTLATRTRSVHRPITTPPPPDTDGDGVPDSADDDIDGDGYRNRQEERAGSDPYDAASTPRKKR